MSKQAETTEKKTIADEIETKEEQPKKVEYEVILANIEDFKKDVYNFCNGAQHSLYFESPQIIFPPFDDPEFLDMIRCKIESKDISEVKMYSWIYNFDSRPNLIRLLDNMRDIKKYEFRFERWLTECLENNMHFILRDPGMETQGVIYQGWRQEFYRDIRNVDFKKAKVNASFMIDDWRKKRREGKRFSYEYGKYPDVPGECFGHMQIYTILTGKDADSLVDLVIKSKEVKQGFPACIIKDKVYQPIKYNKKSEFSPEIIESIYQSSPRNIPDLITNMSINWNDMYWINELTHKMRDKQAKVYGKVIRKHSREFLRKYPEITNNLPVVYERDEIIVE